ncbi:MAG: hypothetical protein AB4040_00430 [Synechococcus sp.]
MILLVASAARAETAIPAWIPSCLPDGATEIEIRGDATVEGREFYYVTANGKEGGFTTLLEGSESSCEVLIAPEDPPTPLHDAIPLEAAKEITLENYQAAAQMLGGTEQLQEYLNSDAGSFETFIWYADEHLWAFEQLGIEIDPHYMLRPADPEVASAVEAFANSGIPVPRTYINSARVVGEFTIARWLLFDRDGTIAGQKVDGEWTVLGAIDSDESPSVTPELLRDRFDIPLETARKLLEE